jgi:hypothetical protein
MKFAFLSIATLALFATGCVSSRFETIGDNKYSPYPSSHPVTIYMKDTWSFNDKAKNDIGQPMLPYASIPAHEIVGKIAVDAAPAAGVNSIIKEAQKRAREMGADGIILDEWKDAEKYVRDVRMRTHHLWADAVRISQK